MTRYEDNKNRRSRRVVICVILSALLLSAISAALFYVYVRYPVRHAETIKRYSAQYGLEPALIFALINAESSFNENAVSSAGASGLMQIMEDTAYWIAPMAGLDDFSYEQILDPDVNIRLGCFYLGMYLERFGGLEAALCAYNAGGGTVEGWLGDPQYSSDGKTLEHIPYAETRHYVERVKEFAKVYEVLLRFVG